MRRQKAAYAVALGATALAGAVRVALGGAPGVAAPTMVLLVAPVMAAAWYGGWKPGLLATALSAAVGLMFVAEPHNGFWAVRANDRLLIASFVAVGCFISLLVDSLHRQAEEKLRASDQRLKHILDDAPACIALHEGPEHRYVYTNAAHDRAVGRRDFVGRTMAEARPGLVGQDVIERFDQVYRSGKPLVVPEFRAMSDRDGDGEAEEGYFWQELQPRFGPDRRVEGVMSFTYDVTEQVRAREALHESEERATGILESITDGLITVDSQWRITYVNRSGAAIVRSLTPHAEELVGRDFWTSFPQLQNTVLEQRYRHARHARETVEFEAFYPPLERWFHVRVFPAHDGGLSIYFLDVTERKLAEEELSRSTAIIEGITKGTEELIAAQDAEYRYVYFNDAYKRTFESLWGKELRVGTSLIEALADWPEELEKAKGVWSRAHAGETFGVTLEFGPSDPEMRTFDSRFNPVLDSSGRQIGAAHILRDVTDQIRTQEALRESEERFRTLADNISQLAWMKDASGHTYWYNQRWYDFTGTTWEEMEGWGWMKCHHPEHIDRVEQSLKHSLETGEPWEITFPLCSKEGQWRWFLTRAVPIRDDDGTIVRWFGTNTDVTEQMEAEEDLRRLAARLSELDRRKDAFLATLAHELRNPLAPISTGLEVMKMAQDDPEQLEQVRSTMERQTQQLVTLVDDLLDVSRITRGKLQLRKSRVALKEVIQSAVEASRPLIDEANHDLSLSLPEQPLFLDADPHRLAQVLSNLINNAAKYTPEGGRIRLTAEREGSDVVVTVQDTGIGIPSDKLDAIFEMFNQVERPMQGVTSGLGIGLTLAKSLVEMHGGRIVVSSEGPDRGSAFTVRLPVVTPTPSGEAPAEPPAEESSASAGCRVLVVDDNKAAADMLGMAVKMLGNDIRMAHDGQQAVQLAADFQPNVILMDIGMPKMNGYEAARCIRQQPWGQQMMLVALTGWGQEEDKRRTKEAGFDHHLVKPAEPSQLRELLIAGKPRREPEPSN